jgi:ribosomal protein S18 acetylase RimI-like enzyme
MPEHALFLEDANEADYPEIIRLVNVAYRGDGSAIASWNLESGILEGTRTDDSLLREELGAEPGSHLLVHRDPEDGSILGTVLLAPAEDAAWYLGMFTIRPELQNRQLGRALLSASEEFAKARGARSICMGVLNVRNTLIGWYERRGYRRTGKSKPFPYRDLRFGRPLRDDLEFVMLEKQL